MAFPLENLRTWSLMAFLSRGTSQWEFTLPFGMPMTGRPEEGLWRQIGAKHPSLLPTQTSMTTTLVFGLMGNILLAIQIMIMLIFHFQVGMLRVRGTGRSWALQGEDRWNGCRKTIWFTIIAQTINDFRTVSLKNAISRIRNFDVVRELIVCYTWFCRVCLFVDIQFFSSFP